MLYPIRTKAERKAVELADRELYGEQAYGSWRGLLGYWVQGQLGEVAAFAALSLDDEDRTIGHLVQCGVVGQYRGLGLQRMLIARRCLAARSYGCRIVRTYTAHWNYLSANNLIKEGFVMQADQPVDWDEEQLFIYWEKRL